MKSAQKAIKSVTNLKFGKVFLAATKNQYYKLYLLMLYLLAVGGVPCAQSLDKVFDDINVNCITVYDERLFLSAYEKSDFRTELWTSDGTREGTAPLFPEGGSPISIIGSFFEFDGKLYFSAFSSSFSSFGTSLYRIDGTAEGLEEFEGISNFFSVSQLIFQDQLYFHCRCEDHVPSCTGGGAGLCRINDSQSEPSLFFSSETSFGISPLHSTESHIFFNFSNGELGTEPWVSSGSPESTFMLKDIAKRNTSNLRRSSNPSDFVSSGNLVYFTASPRSPRAELTNRTIYRTDGSTEGTRRLSKRMIFNGVRDLITINNKIIFGTYYNRRSTLIVSDGSDAGSQVLKSFPAKNQLNAPTNFVLFDNIVLFNWDNFLWRSDGTKEGTFALAPLEINLRSSESNYISFNNIFYFAASTPSFGSELWRTDGTKEGTFLVADLRTSFSSSPGCFTIFNDNLYFTALTDTENFRRELWIISNGVLEADYTGTLLSKLNQITELLERRRNLNGVGRIERARVRRYARDLSAFNESNLDNVRTSLTGDMLRSDLEQIAKKLLRLGRTRNQRKSNRLRRRILQQLELIPASLQLL